MNCVIEKIHRKLQGASRGGQEPHLLKTRHNELHCIDAEKLQFECLTYPRRTLSTVGAGGFRAFIELEHELQVYDVADQVYVSQKHHLRCTMAV